MPLSSLKQCQLGTQHKGLCWTLNKYQLYISSIHNCTVSVTEQHTHNLGYMCTGMYWFLGLRSCKLLQMCHSPLLGVKSLPQYKTGMLFDNSLHCTCQFHKQCMSMRSWMSTVQHRTLLACIGRPLMKSILYPQNSL